MDDRIWPHTRVTGLLGITYPLIQAGIPGGATTLALVAAVSNAGDLGALGVAYLSPDALREAMRTTLGGEPRPISAYARLRTMSPTGSAAEAKEALALGFRTVKTKVGRGDLTADLAVRHAVGDDIALMVDYNQSLTVPEAIDRIRVLDAEGLYWIEEPTRADDYTGHARIPQEARTANQFGENWWSHTMWSRALRRARPTTPCSA